MNRKIGILAVAFGVGIGHAALFAQQAVVSTPMNRVGDSFFERIGVGFGGSINNGRNGPIIFNNGGAGAAIPGVGGFDPNAAANFGFGIRGGGFNGNFNVTAGQGSNRSFSSVTPSVTIPNGGFGAISDTIQQPFVTGLIPIVGGGGAVYNVPRPYYPVVGSHYVSPLRGTIQRYLAGEAAGTAPGTSFRPPVDRPLTLDERLSSRVDSGSAHASSASRGDLSVAELRRAREAGDDAEAQAKRQEIAVLVERARGAEDAGKIGVAKIYYRQAATRASGELRRELVDKLNELSGK